MLCQPFWEVVRMIRWLTGIFGMFRDVGRSDLWSDEHYDPLASPPPAGW